jgi:chorismate mutase
MSRNLLLVDKKILPDFFEKVILARQLINSGEIKEVSEACKRVNISRSTYYKYKDYVFMPEEVGPSRKAVMSLLLNHTHGVLSEVLRCISDHEANVITITQTVPIREKASVILTLDILNLNLSMADLMSALRESDGVEKVNLIDIE